MEGIGFKQVKKMSCREVSRLIAEGSLEDASWPAKLSARLHLLICSHCRRYRRQLRLLARAARHWSKISADPSRLELLEMRLVKRLADLS